jgi:hypothetical protein
MKRQLLTTAAILALAGCATTVTGTKPEEEYTPDSIIIDERSDLSSSVQRYLSDNPTFERGYAGLFTQEDLNGKTIGGYEINPPQMLRPFYSTELSDYFKDFPEVRNYYDALDDELGNNGLATDPYLEEDAAYRSTIMADDNLTVDQKLELIIKNHRGYLGNLEIDELVEEKFSPVYTDYKEVLDQVISRFGYTDVWEAAEQQMPDDDSQYFGYYRSQDEPFHPERHYFFSIAESLLGISDPLDMEGIVLYGDDMAFGYDEHTEYTDELMVKVARAYEILEHRIPALMPYLVGEEGERFTGITINDHTNWMASNIIENRNDASYRINAIYVGPKSLERVRGSIEGNQSDMIRTNERLVTSLFHEYIHNTLTTEGLTALDIDQRALDEAITTQGGTRDTSSYEGLDGVSVPAYTVELNTTLNQGQFSEMLNASPEGVYSSLSGLNTYLRRGGEDGHDFTQDKIFDLIEYNLYNE